MQIFLDDVDYRRFEYLLGDVLEEFQIKCWNYCVMPNHWHMVLWPRADAELSEFMRWLTVSLPGQPGRAILLEKPGPPAMDEATAEGEADSAGDETAQAEPGGPSGADE